MFELREFVMQSLREMVKYELAYKVRQYALGWYDKGVLTEEDLAEVANLTAPLPAPPELAEEGSDEV